MSISQWLAIEEPEEPGDPGFMFIPDGHGHLVLWFA